VLVAAKTHAHYGLKKEERKKKCQTNSLWVEKREREKKNNARQMCF
jgi:hypothetical protein